MADARSMAQEQAALSESDWLRGRPTLSALLRAQDLNPFNTCDANKRRDGNVAVSGDRSDADEGWSEASSVLGARSF